MTLEALRAALAEVRATMARLHEEIGTGEPTDEQRTAWDAADAEERKLATDVLMAERHEAEERSRRAAFETRRAEAARWGGVNINLSATRNGAQPASLAEIRAMSHGEAFDRSRFTIDQAVADRVISSARAEGIVGLLSQSSGTARGGVSVYGTFDGTDVARRLIATENPAYRSAYMAALSGRPMTDGEAMAIRAEQELRALSLSDAAGGYAVPVIIDPTLILTSVGTPNPIIQVSRVELITNDTWRGITSSNSTWYWTGEGAATTASTPTLAQPEITPAKITNQTVYSVEIGMDWPTMARQLGPVLAEGYDQALYSAFTNGTGTGQPWGIISAIEQTVASQVVTSSDGGIVPLDVYTLWERLPEARRVNSVWMANTTVWNKIRQFGTTDPNFTMNLTAGGTPEMFGRRSIQNDYMDTMTGLTTASDASLLIVGDFSSYLIAQRVGMVTEGTQLVTDTTSGTFTGQRAMYSYARVGADSILDNAFRLLTND